MRPYFIYTSQNYKEGLIANYPFHEYKFSSPSPSSTPHLLPLSFYPHRVGVAPSIHMDTNFQSSLI